MINKYIKFYRLNLYDTSTKKLPENLKRLIIPDINIYKHLVTSHRRKGSKKQYKKILRAQALVKVCLGSAHMITAKAVQHVHNYTADL